MTREEARFWLVAMTEAKRRDVAPALLVDQLRAMSKTFGQAITLEDALERIRTAAHHVPEEPLVSLVHPFSPRDWTALAQAARSLEPYPLAIVNHHVLDGFRRHVLPYLPDEDYRVMRDELRGMLGPPALPPD